jgi:hypothetical protein
MADWLKPVSKKRSSNARTWNLVADLREVLTNIRSTAMNDPLSGTLLNDS